MNSDGAGNDVEGRDAFRDEVVMIVVCSTFVSEIYAAEGLEIWHCFVKPIHLIFCVLLDPQKCKLNLHFNKYWYI